MINTYSSALENMTDIESLLVNMNSKMNNSMGVGILLSLFAIVFMLLLRNTGSMKQSFTGSSVFGFLLSYLFWGLGFISLTYVFISFVCLLIGAIWMYHSPD